MAQTTFNASGFASLGTVLAEVSSGGTDAAANTAYTIDLTGGVSGPSAAANLLGGASVELAGGQVIAVPAFAVTGTLVTDLNFTGTVVLDNGVLDNVAVDTTGGITVAGLFTGAVLGTLADNGDSVVNSGVIQSSGFANGIELGTGTVQNGWNGPVTAEILGAASGVQLDTGGLVENGGTIVGGSTNAAVFLASGTVLNGAINDSSAELSGGATGAEISGAGTVVNDGDIIGGTGNGVVLGSGFVSNGQVGDTQALIEAGSAGDGVWITSGSGTVGNYASILAEGASGVYLEAGGTVTNGSSADPQAFISGYDQGILVRGAGTVSNFGSVEADSVSAGNAVGIWLENGGTVVNQLAASYVSGLEWGALVQASAGFVTNLGSILSDSGLGVDLNAGGTVLNGGTVGSATLIDGAVDGVRIAAGAAGAGALVVNDGTIIGNVGVDFKSGATAAAGTVVNDGLIVGTGGYAIEFGSGAEKLVLQSGGTLQGSVLGNDSAGNSTTLKLAAGTNGTLSALGSDGGTVTDSAGSFAFSQIGTIVIDAGAAWTVTSPGTFDVLTNAGGLSFQGGAVSVSTSLANTGTLAIGGGTLTAVSGAVSDQGLVTVGAGGLLAVSGGGISGAGNPDLTVGGVSAALDVTGTLATVNSDGLPIAIGLSGQGSALIDQGATMLAGTPYAADEAISIGASAGATGLLTVSDAGSLLRAAGQLSVGLGGEGSLLIENGASAFAGGNAADATEGLAVGQLATASGEVTVTGSKSLLSVGGPVVVGVAGLGSLAIDASASVSATGSAQIAEAASASGSGASVNDATWRVAGALQVGGAGAGALDIAAAGTVTAASLDAGVLSGGSGVISLSGTATSLSVAGTVGIGDSGQGELSVLDGAAVSIGGNLDIGSAAGGSGNVDIENGTLTVAGAVNLGDGGPGVLTVGAGAHVTVTGGLVGGPDAALVQFAPIDPPYLDGGTDTINFSGEQDFDAYVDGGASINIDQGYSLALDTPLVTGGVQFAIGGSAGDTQATTLVLNAGSVDSSVDITFKSKLGTLVIGTDALAAIDTQASDAAGVTLVANPDLGVPLIGGFYGYVFGFKAGDQVIVDTAQAATFAQSGNAVSVNAGGVTLGTLTFATTAMAKLALGGLADQVVACFAAGTRIRTDRGEVAVEDVREGDRAWSVLGACHAPVVWVGRRHVDCARHPRPAAVWPVRIAAGAFGPGTPGRDVWLSPDHAVYVEGVLVPARYLVNGTTVRQERRPGVTYYHIELDRHDVLLADGLPAESYLDTGTRRNFANGGGVMTLHPDFSRAGDVWEMQGCAPLVVTGPDLQAIRGRLTAMARAA